MRTILRCLLVLGLAAWSAQAHAAGVVAKLVVPETKLLPGVAFEAWIELENQSTETIAVGLQPTLLATVSNGERFEARNKNNDYLLDYDNTNPPIHYLQMRSHERRTVPMALTTEAPYVFSDVHILYPGRYTIAVRLGEWRSNGEEIYSAPPPEYSGPVETNDVTIERVAMGEDAVVWQRMQEVANGAWKLEDWRNRLLNEEIVAKHPASNYVPYAIIAGAFMKEPARQVKLMVDAIERFPSSPVLEYLRDAAASEAGFIGESDIRDRELEILRQSRRPTIRLRVSGRAEFVQSRDTMARY